MRCIIVSVFLEGQAHGLDLELPAHVPIAELLPDIALLFGQSEDSLAPETSVDPARTLSEEGIRDGGSIILCKKLRTIDTSTP